MHKERIVELLKGALPRMRYAGNITTRALKTAVPQVLSCLFELLDDCLVGYKLGDQLYSWFALTSFKLR